MKINLSVIFLLSIRMERAMNLFFYEHEHKNKIKSL